MLFSRSADVDSRTNECLIQKISARLQQWSREHLIAEDPYDQEAWNASLLATQKVLNIEHFPKELY